jgi:hypothetical protein
MSRDPRERSEQHLPKLRLDELLGELQVRIDAVRGTRDRLHSLLEAVLSVGRELDLPRSCAASSRPPACWWTPSTGRWE